MIVAPTAAAKAPTASFDWEMPDRLRDDNYGNVRHLGVMNWLGDGSDYRLGGPIPASYPVKLDACASSPGDQPIDKYVWSVDGRRVHTRDDCGPVTRRFREEGVYDVTLTVTAGGESSEATQQVRVEDWLVVSLGDSVASGEGNPDVAKGPGIPRPVWRDRACHRSGRAGPARAALALEHADRRTSVTFVHLACSGATIRKGLLGNFKGKEPQVEVLRKLALKREVDAVMLSVGANDVRFAGVVKFCLANSSCDRDTLDRQVALKKGLESGLAYLPTGYRTLADHLHGPTGIPPDRVLMTDYFNPTREGQDFCNGVVLNEREWRFAETDVLKRLNPEVRRAAGRYGWTHVTGFGDVSDDEDVDGFFRHGYCTDDRWVVRITESLARQGDTRGGVHPNGLGHRHYGERLKDELIRTLYRDGDLSRPRRPAGPPELSLAGELPDETLARMFRPRLLFSRREHWRPLEVDAFLEEGHHMICPRGSASEVRRFLAELSTSRKGCRKIRSAEDLVRRPPAPTEGLLVNGTRSSKIDPYEAPNLDCNARLDEGLRDRLFDCDTGSASAIYWHVVRPPGSWMAYIDYWWFLRYNDTDGARFFDHQSDWEGMVVAVDLRSRPRTFEWAAYAAHEGEPWRYPRELMRCDGVSRGSCGTDRRPRGRRPSAYIADGSHAAYGLPCERRDFRDTFDCGQNEPGPERIERDFAGAHRWGRDDDRDALLGFPAGSWATWKGIWSGTRGSVRTPRDQDRWRAPWRHRSTACDRPWCGRPLELAGLHQSRCGEQPPATPAARVCQAGGPVVIERFSEGRSTPRQSERGEGVVELRGAALDLGRIEVSGTLSEGTTVFIRGLGNELQEHEAAFTLPSRVDGNARLRVRVEPSGSPVLQVVRPGRVNNVRPEVDARVS